MQRLQELHPITLPNSFKPLSLHFEFLVQTYAANSAQIALQLKQVEVAVFATRVAADQYTQL